jgi:chromate reductase
MLVDADQNQTGAVMDQAVRRTRLLGLPGSLRKTSYSRAVLRGLEIELGATADFEIRDVRLPLYNEDEDGAAAPEIVRQFRQAIDQSDGIVIATPEYNHGIPGVLKNALDWASRPIGRSVLIDKPVLAMSVSPASTGGVRAQAQVHETLLAIPAHIVTGPQIVIGNVAEKIREVRWWTSRFYASRYRPSTDLPRPAMYVEPSRI